MINLVKTTSTLCAAGCVLAVLILGLMACSEDQPEGDGSTNNSAAPDETAPDAVSTDGYPDHLISALETAAADNKIVMVELHDPSCKTCNDMDRAVFSKPAVKTLLEEMIHVKIGPDDRGVINKFGLSIIPSFVLLKPTGEQMPPMLEGYRPSKRLAKELENFNLIADGQPAVDLGPERHPQFGKG